MHGRSAFTGKRRMCGGYSKYLLVALEEARLTCGSQPRRLHIEMAKHQLHKRGGDGSDSVIMMRLFVRSISHNRIRRFPAW